MAKTSPSLRDVAQAAGVSLTTASRVLNNKSSVQSSTRSSVLKAAADLGYKLQVRAISPVTSKFNTIGAIIKRDAYEQNRLDPFYYAVLCGIEDECQRLGISLMYASMQVDDYSQATSIPTLVENSDIDGLVIVGVVFSNATLAKRIPTHIPIVIVDASAVGIECDTINTDNLVGAYKAVSYLIEQGHRHIGLIGSTMSGSEHPSIRERREGYLKALADHGIQETYIEDSIMNSEIAYQATLKLLQRAPHVTAIFSCNDAIGQHVIQAAKDVGRRVPEDVSVVGFDNTDASSVSRPPMTTVQVDKELMGAIAVRQLQDQAANRNRVSINVMMGTKLVIRESVLSRTREPKPPT
jgi:LacI family transcriptional regulator